MNAEKIDSAKLTGICRRLSIAPAGMRQAVIQELIDLVDERNHQAARSEPVIVQDGAKLLRDLRGMMRWQEVRENGPALAKLARLARTVRESIEK